MGFKNFWEKLTTIDGEVIREMEHEERQSKSSRMRDELLIVKIIKLKSIMSNHSPIQEEEHEILLKYNEKYKSQQAELADTYELEKIDLKKAIMIYEKYVSNRWNYTTVPYDRLSIIYRKQKLYQEEIRVLKTAIFVVSGKEIFEEPVVTNSLFIRLEKAILLNEKA